MKTGPFRQKIAFHLHRCALSFLGFLLGFLIGGIAPGLLPPGPPGYFPCSSLTPLPLSSRRPSPSIPVLRWIRAYLEEPGDTCVASDAERGTITANLLDLPFMVPGQSAREHLPKLTGGILLCEVEQPVFVPGVLIDG